jgi:hypothetical protein
LIRSERIDHDPRGGLRRLGVVAVSFVQGISVIWPYQKSASGLR